MTSFRKKLTIGIFACVAMIGAQAQSQTPAPSKTQAQTSTLTGVYAGGNIGSTTITDLGSKVGFGGFVGYNFNENIAVEAGAQSLGTFNVSGIDVNASAYNASLLAGVAINPQFSVYGRVGYGTLKAAVDGAQATVNSSLYGVGARYHFDKNLAVRVDYTRYASDTGVFSVGAQYAF